MLPVISEAVVLSGLHPTAWTPACLLAAGHDVGASLRQHLVLLPSRAPTPKHAAKDVSKTLRWNCPVKGLYVPLQQLFV